ncbi:MAG TPA: ABC transporter permease subunit, partial [Pirellulaceae bacterium]|nr:ABC transporter permease subunit [Pirellulaceae bacterium]
LSPWALPQYTLLSLGRGLTAFLISLVFTLVYGYWAAKSEAAGRLLIPLLDVLQSLPVLAFLPGLLLTLDAAFPRNNVGLELAAVLMIFTGQAWNMTFSFYHSIRAVPPDMREAADVYRFNWWQRLKWVELPFATIGLVWNSMMSMAGGWFFLMINESYQLGDKDFRLPGLGSYMQVAANEGRVDAMIWAMGAMLAMIVALDQLLWRPIVVWSQRFRVEEGGQRSAMKSWVLTALQRSRLLRVFERVLHRHGSRTSAPRVGEVAGSFADAGENELKVESRASEQENTRFGQWASRAALLSVVAALVLGAVRLASLLGSVTLHDWLETWAAAGVTLLRVLTAIGAATIWTVPAGLAIGLSPRLSRVLQPVVQVCASFPAPMLFPMALAVFQFAGVSLNFGAVV